MSDDPTDILTGVPDVLLGFAVAAVIGSDPHLEFVRLRQIVGIQACPLDTASQVIAVDAGKQISVGDIGDRGLVNHVFI